MRWFGVIACSICLTAAAWHVRKHFAHSKSDPPRYASPVETSPNRSALIFAGGIVEGNDREHMVRTELEGRVRAVHVHEGNVVQEGDLLVELDSDVWELRVREAKAHYAIASAERRRLTSDEHSVGEAQPVSQTDRRADVAASSYDIAIADARLAIAESAVRREILALEKTRLRAPVSGQVVEIVVQQGDLVSPASARDLVVVVDRSTTRVRAFIEEFDAMTVAPGQPALVSVAGLPQKRYSGRIAGCAPSVRPKSHLHRKPGERVDVRVREAVIELDDGSDLLLGLPVEILLKPIGITGNAH